MRRTSGRPAIDLDFDLVIEPAKLENPLQRPHTEKLWSKSKNFSKAKNGRTQLLASAFNAEQERMMAAGSPEDPCGRCHCLRKDHKAKPTFPWAKSGGSSGKSVEVPVLAPTSCDCPY